TCTTRLGAAMAAAWRACLARRSGRSRWSRKPPPSVRPRHPIAAARLAQELVQLVDGQGRRARMARGYLAQEIEVVPHEDPEVPRVGRLVDADEVPPRAGSREEATPLPNRHHPDRIDAMREQGDEQLVKGGGLVEICLQRAPRTQRMQ